MALPVVNRECSASGDSDTELSHGCDDLAAINEHLLPEALGCKNWLSARLSSVAELKQVLERIDSHDGAACVEVMIPNEESQPMPEATIDSGHKRKAPAIG